MTLSFGKPIPSDNPDPCPGWSEKDNVLYGGCVLALLVLFIAFRFAMPQGFFPFLIATVVGLSVVAGLTFLGLRIAEATQREKLITQAIAGTGCTAEEALDLLDCPESELFAGATQIREAHFGKWVQLCSIINAKSGRCDMDCRFCSQSDHNTTDIDSYPLMENDTLQNEIQRIVTDGTRRCGLVTSGGKLESAELGQLTETIGRIEEEKRSSLCASLGRLTKEELDDLKASGVTRYHHNLETSEPYYPEICSTQEWSERVQTIQTAMKAGLQVCCGGLFGLGESWQDRIDLAITLRELGVDSVPINFLHAHPGTPLKDMPALSASEALRIIALYRFLLPTTTLRICGGRERVLGDRQADLFAAGANGLMTGNLLTVAGSQAKVDRAMIRRLGLELQPA